MDSTAHGLYILRWGVEVGAEDLDTLGLIQRFEWGLGFWPGFGLCWVVNTFQRSSLVGLKTSAPADGRESQTYRFVLNWEPIS